MALCDSSICSTLDVYLLTYLLLLLIICQSLLFHSPYLAVYVQSTGHVRHGAADKATVVGSQPFCTTVRVRLVTVPHQSATSAARRCPRVAVYHGQTVSYLSSSVQSPDVC